MLVITDRDAHGFSIAYWTAIRGAEVVLASNRRIGLLLSTLRDGMAVVADRGIDRELVLHALQSGAEVWILDHHIVSGRTVRMLEGLGFEVREYTGQKLIADADRVHIRVGSGLEMTRELGRLFGADITPDSLFEKQNIVLLLGLLADHDYSAYCALKPEQKYVRLAHGFDYLIRRNPKDDILEWDVSRLVAEAEKVAEEAESVQQKAVQTFLENEDMLVEQRYTGKRTAVLLDGISFGFLHTQLYHFRYKVLEKLMQDGYADYFVYSIVRPVVDADRADIVRKYYFIGPCWTECRNYAFDKLKCWLERQNADYYGHRGLVVVVSRERLSVAEAVRLLVS